MPDQPSPKWDNYFFRLSRTVADQSPCLSRQIGAILVRDRAILSTGYNGPPRGVEHCLGECPRQVLKFRSGEGLQFCTAVHAEANAIINAARHGVFTLGSTLYLSCSCFPCKDCTSKLINAGVVEIVATAYAFYDQLSERLLNEVSDRILIRTYVS